MCVNSQPGQAVYLCRPAKNSLPLAFHRSQGVQTLNFHNCQYSWLMNSWIAHSNNCGPSLASQIHSSSVIYTGYLATAMSNKAAGLKKVGSGHLGHAWAYGGPYFLQNTGSHTVHLYQNLRQSPEFGLPKSQLITTNKALCHQACPLQVVSCVGRRHTSIL